MMGALLIPIRPLLDSARLYAPWLAVAGVCYAAAIHWVWVNWTPSVPYTVGWIEYGASPRRGDLVAYRFSGPGFAGLRGALLLKRVSGVPGDPVTVSARVVSVAGRPAGYAKRYSRSGVPLTPALPGVIPPGYLFVAGDHQDSFDSRYAEAGLVPAGSIVGVAHALF